MEAGRITDGAFVGDGCAISQASADMMLDLIIGKSEEEAMKLAGKIFLRMIKGEVTDEEMDQLEEASVLKDISHMPARVKCAVLGWHTMEEMLKTEKRINQITEKGISQIFFLCKEHGGCWFETIFNNFLIDLIQFLLAVFLCHILFLSDFSFSRSKKIYLVNVLPVGTDP